MEEACSSQWKQSTVVDARRIQLMRCRPCSLLSFRPRRNIRIAMAACQPSGFSFDPSQANGTALS